MKTNHRERITSYIERELNEASNLIARRSSPNGQERLLRSHVDGRRSGSKTALLARCVAAYAASADRDVQTEKHRPNARALLEAVDSYFETHEPLELLVASSPPLRARSTSDTDPQPDPFVQQLLDFAPQTYCPDVWKRLVDHSARNPQHSVFRLAQDARAAKLSTDDAATLIALRYELALNHAVDGTVAACRHEMRTLLCSDAQPSSKNTRVDWVPLFTPRSRSSALMRARASDLINASIARRLRSEYGSSNTNNAPRDRIAGTYITHGEKFARAALLAAATLTAELDHEEQFRWVRTELLRQFRIGDWTRFVKSLDSLSTGLDASCHSDAMRCLVTDRASANLELAAC